MEETNFDRYLDRKLRDPVFARRFEQASREWDIALEIARARQEVGLSQTQLAKLAGTTQQQISRLEQPGYRGSLKTLYRVAEALGRRVEIALPTKEPMIEPEGAVGEEPPEYGDKKQRKRKSS